MPPKEPPKCTRPGLVLLLPATVVLANSLQFLPVECLVLRCLIVSGNQAAIWVPTVMTTNYGDFYGVAANGKTEAGQIWQSVTI
jgi:spore maturation protein SpmA